VKYRKAMITNEWEGNLRAYITGIVQNQGHKMLAINNMPDHIHIFIGMNPKQSISDLMRMVKGESSEWININKLTNRHFNWQEGYGAFSYSRSHIDNVVKYIHNQQEHHKKITFMEEYKSILEKFGIEYDDRYIFQNLLND
jgi:REP element-mobilizing transposase RayT